LPLSGAGAVAAAEALNAAPESCQFAPPSVVEASRVCTSWNIGNPAADVTYE